MNRKFDSKIHETDGIRGTSVLGLAERDTRPIWNPYYAFRSAASRRSTDSCRRLWRKRSTEMLRTRVSSVYQPLVWMGKRRDAMDLQLVWNDQRRSVFLFQPSYYSHNLQSAPQEYRAGSDLSNRPELRRGTVDFLVPSAYWAPVPPKRLIHSFIPVGVDSGTTARASLDTKSSLLKPVETATRRPAPINYVFALDVSLEAAQGGFLRSVCDILLDILYGDRSAGSTIEADTATEQPSKRSWWNPESKLAIVTYDRELCFYDLSVRSAKHAFIVL
jgi:hypothetical protein